MQWKTCQGNGIVAGKASADLHCVLRRSQWRRGLSAGLGARAGNGELEMLRP